MPVLAGMIVETGPTGAVLAAFDYELMARVTVPADVGGAGRVLVHGRELVKAVQGLPGGPGDTVTVTAEDAGDTLTAECLGVSATVGRLPMGDYPQLPAMPPESAAFASAAFAATVARVAVAAGTDDTLPALTCVQLKFGEKAGAEFAATDRYRLATETADCTFAAASPAGRELLIPARDLAAFAKAAANTARVTVHVAAEPAGNGYGTYVGLSDGTRETTVRTNDGDFPRTGALVPATTDATADIDAATLAAALKRAGAACTRNEAVRLHFYRDTVTITGHGGDGQVASTQTIPAKLHTPGNVIGWWAAFDAGYLRSMTAAGGTVRLGFRAAGGRVKPILVTSDTAGGWTGLVCPIRLDGRYRQTAPKPAAPAPKPTGPAPATAPPSTPQTRSSHPRKRARRTPTAPAHTPQDTRNPYRNGGNAPHPSTPQTRGTQRDTTYGTHQ